MSNLFFPNGKLIFTIHLKKTVSKAKCPWQVCFDDTAMASNSFSLTSAFLELVK